jgi:parallel beta-helix repeat protein
MLATCLLAATAWLAKPAAAKVISVPASDRLEFAAQEALLEAEPGDTVLLPEGRFALSQELSITKPFITLKGQGMTRTTLVYGDDAGGPQAIISYADHVTIEDLGIENHPGDGIKTIGADGVAIRRVKVEWTAKGSVSNGAYGLYPVKSSNVLLEDNLIIGASDAGIYVGQSHDIVVRRNRVEYNVAGIEIENSQRADVYDNVATNNTGGILVFNLPNLMVQGGAGTRVFQNHVHDNNFENFAPEGNSVAMVPPGTGILVMANPDVEIFKNTIERHDTTSIAVVSYHITQSAIQDERYRAVPEHVYIHDNELREAGSRALLSGNQLGVVAAALSFPHRVPHITYDGIGHPDGKDGFLPARLEGNARICIGVNTHDGGEHAYFGNLQLWKQKWWSPIPGDLDRELGAHACTLPPLPAVALADTPAVPVPVTPAPSPEQVRALCESAGDGVNWQALPYDCPRLSSYRFFRDLRDPLSGPREGGFTYELTTPLFSDYASKDRALFLPPGTQAGYRAEESWDLPVGAAIAKTFYYPADLRTPDGPRKLVETRVIVHRAGGFKSLAYRWNDDGTDAELVRGGAELAVAWTDEAGAPRRNDAYRIPNEAQCAGCHLDNRPIGVKTGYLNRSGHDGQNQLAALVKAGRLADAPPDPKTAPVYPVWNDPRTGTLEARARTYLDINCAHCHSPVGKGNTSGLYLLLAQPANINLGICKPPVAAGRGTGGTLFDIIPGNPKESLLVQRLISTKAAAKMPELGKSMTHTEGVALVSDWIAALPGSCDP